VDNKCLQGKNFKNLGCQIFYENDKELAKHSQILGILNNTFKPNLVHKISTIKVYNAQSPLFFYMEAKFGPLEKRIQND
jgi:hypothetical protein